VRAVGDRLAEVFGQVEWLGCHGAWVWECDWEYSAGC
jgi:hypothetical protein